MAFVMCPFRSRDKRDILEKGQPFILCTVVVIRKDQEVQAHAAGENGGLNRFQNPVGGSGVDMGVSLKKPAFL